MDELLQEIHAFIDDKINNGVSVHFRYAVAFIMNKHKDVTGKDAPLMKLLASQEVKRLAKAAIGRYETADETPEQMRFPGFTHLCKAYPVLRKGKRLLMPVELMFSHERQERANQLDAMAAGCTAHAEELRAYDRVMAAEGVPA